MFYGCNNLAFLVLNSGVVAVEESAFEDFANLSEVVVGKTVATIGKNAFAGTSLAAVYFDGSFYEWLEIRVWDDGLATAKRYYSKLQSGELGNRWYYDSEGNIVTEVMENLPPVKN